MAAKKKAVTTPKATKLPPGFTAISAGASGAFHNFNDNPTLQGKIVALGTMKGNYGVQKTMTVKTADNMQETVTASASLSGLFKEKKLIGRQVFIHFDGEKKLKGKKRVRLFTVGLK